ncbi:hypothetical protein [Arenimonas sp. MALMAid1274]|uniref:hypothetical protein n=1 Tax=Arenimonas sp. MALMAid1274 TaxID=3411630 RepID=UPI003BA0DD0C
MGKRLKWIVLVPLALFAAALLTVHVLRWLAVDDADREALATMQVDERPSQGRSGFAALALADRDIPLEQRERVVGEDVRAFEAWLADPKAAHAEGLREVMFDPQQDNFASWEDTEQHLQVAGHFPYRETPPMVEGTCSLREFGCLQMVRTSPRVAEVWLRQHADALARADVALAADHLRNPYPPSWDTPFVSYALLRLPLNQAALDAVQDRVPQALSRACRTLAGARRIAGRPEHLLDKMIGDALAEGAASLLLDIRREHAALPLPAECDEALRPVLAQAALACPSIRGEFRIHSATRERMAAALAASWNPRDVIARLLLSDRKLMSVWLARSASTYCSQDYVRQVLDGHLPPPRAHEPIAGTWQCFAAVLDCILLDIATQSYVDYQARMLDSAATLRVLLAAQAAAGGELEDKALAAAAASPGYDVRLDTSTGELLLTLKKPREGEESGLRIRYRAVGGGR